MHQYSLTKNNDILKLTSLFIIKLLHFTHLGQLFSHMIITHAVARQLALLFHV